MSVPRERAVFATISVNVLMSTAKAPKYATDLANCIKETAMPTGTVIVVSGPTPEQAEYLKRIAAHGPMSQADIDACTCQIGGKKNPNRKPCPVHNR